MGAAHRRHVGVGLDFQRGVLLSVGSEDLDTHDCPAHLERFIESVDQVIAFPDGDLLAGSGHGGIVRRRRGAGDLSPMAMHTRPVKCNHREKEKPCEENKDDISFHAVFNLLS